MYYTFIYYECIIWCMYTKGCIKCYILLWLFTKVSIYYRFLVCIALYKYTMYVNCGYIKLLKTYEMHVPHMAATTAWGGVPTPAELVGFWADTPLWLPYNQWGCKLLQMAHLFQHVNLKVTKQHTCLFVRQSCFILQHLPQKDNEPPYQWTYEHLGHHTVRWNSSTR